MKLIYRFLFFIAFLISYQGMAQSGLKLGTAPGTLTANAILDLSGTSTRGLLLPRVSLSATNSTSPLSAPVASGMFVYNIATTTGTGTNLVIPGIYYYDGSVWVRAQDNLGNHTATQDINIGRFGLSGFADVNSTTGNNDDWKIFGSGNADEGSLVIQTGDNGNEPIVFQQRVSGTVSERMRINNTGALQVSGLSGTGIRLVTASSAGVLSTQTMLDLSNISGTLPLAKLTAGTSGQILQMSAGTTTTPTWVTPTTANSLNIYTADGTLAGARTVDQSTNALTFSGTGYLHKRSNSTASPAALTVGRTSTEAEFGIAGGTGQGFTATSAGDVWLKSNIAGGNLFLGTAGTGAELHLMTNNAERMVITPGGNVGIGTSNPDFKLDVVGGGIRALISGTTASPAGAIELSTPGGDPGIIIRSAGTAGTSASLTLRSNMRRLSTGLLINNSTTGGLDSTFFIQNNGNVGIGRIKPARVLHTSGDAVRFDRNGGSNGENPMPQALFVNTNGSEIYKTWVSGMANSTMDYVISDFGTAVGSVDGTQRFVIKGTNGNVGIGTSNPSVRLHVEQVGTTEQMIILNPGTTAQTQNQFSNAGLRITSAKRNVDLSLVSNENSESRINFARESIGKVSAMLRGSTYGFDIRTNSYGDGSVALFIDNNQNVGIGTGKIDSVLIEGKKGVKNPILAKLHVNGGDVLFDVDEKRLLSDRHVLIKGNLTDSTYKTPGTAALDVSSKSRGFLPPRMTAHELTTIRFDLDSTTVATAADSLASEGLVVYCTDCVPKTILTFDGTEWLDPLGVGLPINTKKPDLSATSSNGKMTIKTTDGEWKNFKNDIMTFRYQWFKRTGAITIPPNNYLEMKDSTNNSVTITPVSGDSYYCKVFPIGSLYARDTALLITNNNVTVQNTATKTLTIKGYGNYFHTTSGADIQFALGTSYQWQVSPNGTTGWTNLGDALQTPTLDNVFLNLPDANYGNFVRLQLTCTGSNNSSATVYSTAIQHQPLLNQQDILSAADIRALYSVRRLRAGYTGHCMEVMKLTTGGVTSTHLISFSTDGNIDITALASLSLGATLFVTTWFDQSGMGRNAIATWSSNPLLNKAPIIASGGIVNTMNGDNNIKRPTIVFDGTNDYLAVNTTTNPLTPQNQELFFSVRMEHKNTTEWNGGLIQMSNVTGTALHFGGKSSLAGPGNRWFESFFSSTRGGFEPNGAAGLKNVRHVKPDHNYVGGMVRVSNALRATLNSSTAYIDNGSVSFINLVRTSLIGTNLTSYGIGSNLENLHSGNEYSELILIQGKSDNSMTSNIRRRIMQSIGGYYGVTIKSGGGY